MSSCVATADVLEYPLCPRLPQPFDVVEHTLRKAVHELIGGGLLAVAPAIVMHPLEMIEGGLSDVEERVMRELAIGARARNVVVWTGPELSDADVKARLKEGTKRAGRS